MIGASNHSQSNNGNDTFWALKDVSFEVEKGEVIGIIGRNGAGKSTLLKILSRVTAPTTGEVKIKGRIASLLEVGTGFHPELTGLENIYLNGSILGMKKHEIDTKFDEIVRFAEIEKFLDTPVKRYSSGMYVRLAFAVAAHLEPEILIIDEVLAVGDAAFQKKCLGKMSEVAKGGRTVLFVSHNMSAIKALCSRTILLEDGQVDFNGVSATAVEKYLTSNISDPSSIPIAERKRESKCSLRAKIIGLTVITEEGENPEYLDSKKPFTVRFTIESYFNIKCSAQIMVGDGIQPLSYLDSANLSGKIYNLKQGISEIECKIGPLYLYGGDYEIACAIVVPMAEVIDYIQDAYSFKVQEFDPYNSGYNVLKSYGFGIYHIDHKWGEVKTK